MNIVYMEKYEMWKEKTICGVIKEGSVVNTCSDLFHVLINLMEGTLQKEIRPSKWRVTNWDESWEIFNL